MHTIVYQSVFCGEIDKFPAIVAGDTALRPEPDRAIRVSVGRSYNIMRQSISCGKVNEILPVVTGNAAALCRESH